jgi:hypothetical protein
LTRPNRSAISLRQNHSCSFDHLVGNREQLVRHGNTERLRGLEVDQQLELGQRLHRKVGRLLALEDAIDVASREPVLVDEIRPIGDQAAGSDKDTMTAGSLWRAPSVTIRSR